MVLIKTNFATFFFPSTRFFSSLTVRPSGNGGGAYLGGKVRPRVLLIEGVNAGGGKGASVSSLSAETSQSSFFLFLFFVGVFGVARSCVGGIGATSGVEARGGIRRLSEISPPKEGFPDVSSMISSVSCSLSVDSLGNFRGDME